MKTLARNWMWLVFILAPIMGAALLARPAWRDRHQPFAVTAVEWRHDYERMAGDLPALPEYLVTFNAAIDPTVAQRYLRFEDRLGQRIPANVRAGYGPSAAALLVPTHQPLFVSPERALSPGKGWQLVVAKGLPAADGRHRLASDRIELLGDVRPFTVEAVIPHNRYYGGKEIALVFSKPLPPALGLTASNLFEWISVHPAPTNLSAAFWGNRIALRGAYELDRAYTVVVRPGLPSASVYVTEQTLRRQVRFAPLPARVFFPEFTTHQWSSGQRQYPLLALNTPSVRLRVKALEPHNLVHALRGYRSYFRDWRDCREDESPYQELDFNLIPGQTILQTNLETRAPRDVPRPLDLAWNLLAKGRKTGAFFLAADTAGLAEDQPRAGVQSLIQLSDLGLAWKHSPGGILVYLFSYDTGKPVANGTVRWLSDENEPLQTGRTDSSGLASFSPVVPSQQLMPENAPRLWLMAETEADAHAIEGHPDQHELPLYSFRLPLDRDGEPPPAGKVFLFTDRGVYRPGETVQVKALVREQDHGALILPRQSAVILRAFDPRDRLCYSTNTTLSRFGSLGAAIPLPQSPCGFYRLETEWNGQVCHVHSLQIQEFKADAFRVEIEARPAYAAGEPVEIPVRGRYFFGQSLARAAVAWSLTAENAPLAPPEFASYQFGPTRVWKLSETENPGGSRQGRAELSGDGVLVLRPELPLATNCPQPRQVDLLVEVTDLNQQTLSQRASFVQHSSDFYLGLKLPATVVAAGEELPLELVAVATNGRPLAEAVAAHLTVSRLDWHTLRVQSSSGAIAYDSQLERRELFTLAVTVPPLESVGGSDGRAPVTLKLPAAGLYLLALETKDHHDRRVLTTTTVQVHGEDHLAWNYRNAQTLELAPDRASYDTGQKAVILVKTPISGEALVTIERDQVLRSFVTSLRGSAPTVEVPLMEGDTPNVFVSVLLIRGAADCPKQVKSPEYRLGYCQLSVASPAARLTVKVRSEVPEYQPGQMVQATVQVLEASGRPVPDTEVTLSAVDEGVLSLTGSPTPDPYGCFFAPQPLAVRTFLSLPSLFPEDPEQRQFGNKGYLIGGGGMNPRRKFLPCAFWNGSLVTDAAGYVRASFPAPDSLTRYRLCAVAHNTRQQFGAGEAGFAVNKPLMIDPATPPFARVGDELVARALVHNQTDWAGEVVVTLELDDLARAMEADQRAPKVGGQTANGSLTTIHHEQDIERGGQSAKGSNRKESVLSQILSLPAKGVQTAEFPLTFLKTGAARWIWRARFADPAAGTFADAVENALTVEHRAPLLRHIHNLRTVSAATDLLAGVAPQALAGNGMVVVSLSNTRLSWVAEAISHLLHYPYGCVEQTSSSLIPWLVLSGRNWPRIDKTPAEVQAATCAGAKRLLSMQTDSGGLSYWPRQPEPLYWGSAYGGLALTLAQRGGAAVPEDDLKKLYNYLSAGLRGGGSPAGNDSTSARCLALYTLALAGRPEAAYHEQFYQRRASLSPEDRAWLALAVLESRGPSAMVEDLLPANPSRKPADYGWFGCEARLRALELLALCQHRPDDPKVEKLVEQLVALQTEGHWFTTQGNAWALLALVHYAQTIENRNGPIAGQLQWGSLETPFALPDTMANVELRLPFSPDQSGAPLLLAYPAHRPLYLQVCVETHPAAPNRAPVDHGFRLQRRYERVADDGTLSAANQLRVGDRILVTLELELRQPAQYLAVVDPLPAVFEPVNPHFKTRQTRADTVLANDWFSDYQEFRADCALFFRNYLWTGKHRVRYLARVRAAGQTLAPAAKVEEMYQPDRCGLSAPLLVTAQSAEPQ